jgi:hypothetical protein
MPDLLKMPLTLELLYRETHGWKSPKLHVSSFDKKVLKKKKGAVMACTGRTNWVV